MFGRRRPLSRAGWPKNYGFCELGNVVGRRFCGSPRGEGTLRELPPPHLYSDHQAQPGADVRGQGNVARESTLQRQGVEDSTIESEGKPLKVVYWNVANIPAKDIDTFLGDLDKELQWDVLVLLEFWAARREIHLSGVRRAGHLVAAQPFANGRRAGALVFSSTTTGARRGPCFTRPCFCSRFQLGRLEITYCRWARGRKWRQGALPR